VLPSLRVLASFGLVLMVTRTYDRNRGQMSESLKISLLKRGRLHAPILDENITNSTLVIYFYINSALQKVYKFCIITTTVIHMGSHTTNTTALYITYFKSFSYVSLMTELYRPKLVVTLRVKLGCVLRNYNGLFLNS